MQLECIMATTTRERMLSRDAKRRIEVIKKKLQDLQEMGVPCSFCYCTPWTGGLYITGDQRIGREVKAITNRILASLEEEEEAEERAGEEEGGERDRPMAVFQLPRLKVPLEDLNQRTLVSMLVGIAKDIRLRWDGEQPRWWPDGIPFVHPREAPVHYRGKWIEALRTLLREAYHHFGCEELLHAEGASGRVEREQEQAKDMNHAPAQYFSVITSNQGSSPPRQQAGETTTVGSNGGRALPQSLSAVIPISSLQQPTQQEESWTSNLHSRQEDTQVQVFAHTSPILVPVMSTKESSIPKSNMHSEARTTAAATASSPPQQLHIRFLTPTFPAIVPIQGPQQLSTTKQQPSVEKRTHSTGEGEKNRVKRFTHTLPVAAPISSPQNSTATRFPQGKILTQTFPILTPITSSLRPTPSQHHRENSPTTEAEKGPTRLQVFTKTIPVSPPTTNPQRPGGLKRRRQERQQSGHWQKRSKNDFHYYEYVPNAVHRPKRK